MMDKEQMKKESERLLASADLPTGMDQIGMTLHPVYTSLRKGGFTKYEALWMCGYVLMGGANSQLDEPDVNSD
jgi:hypothetical protein